MYFLHVFILPVVVTTLILAHLFIVWVQGIAEPHWRRTVWVFSSASAELQTRTWRRGTSFSRLMRRGVVYTLVTDLADRGPS